MITSLKFLRVFSALLFLCVPFFVSAHQPRIATVSPITVTDPEISKAYYGTLPGEPVIYRIVSPTPFALYVNVLVPDISGQKKDVSFDIFKDGYRETPLAILKGSTFSWKKFFEPFGHDTYWQGPEYKNLVEAGTYEIQVRSTHNDSKYSLAIGETESFDFKEGIHALTLIPQLKRSFFNETPLSFILSPFGYGLIIAMFVLSFLFGFVLRLILSQMGSNITSRRGINIANQGRLLRFALGLIFFVWAITTSWSPLLLFVAGFCIFEACFSWCGFKALMGT